MFIVVKKVKNKSLSFIDAIDRMSESEQLAFLDQCQRATDDTLLEIKRKQAINHTISDTYKRGLIF